MADASLPALQRFRASMAITYEQWREGEPYDLSLIPELTAAERELIATELSAKHKLDWRDVEALAALDTPAARTRIARAREKQVDAGGAAALEHLIATEGWSAEAEQCVIAMLADMKAMEGASHRLYAICTEHPTPAILAQLMRSARIQSDPTMRYSTAAFLLYLSGHSEDWYGFGPHRPHLLNLNSSDYKTYKAAVAWLENMVANPAPRTQG